MVGQVTRDWAQDHITVCIQPLTSVHRHRPASSPVTPAQTPIIELHLINVKGHPVNNIFAHKVYVVNKQYSSTHILNGMNTCSILVNNFIFVPDKGCRKYATNSIYIKTKPKESPMGMEFHALSVTNAAAEKAEEGFKRDSPWRIRNINPLLWFILGFSTFEDP